MHTLLYKKRQIFQHFLQENNTRCRVCLQKCTTKTIFSLSILIIEPDSLHSERDISSEDSPPEKPVNGKHTSILPSQVPSHLLMISILEHLCQMYAQDAEQGKKLFQGKNKNSPKDYLKRRGQCLTGPTHVDFHENYIKKWGYFLCDLYVIDLSFTLCDCFIIIFFFK